jgi:hypothetical protein
MPTICISHLLAEFLRIIFLLSIGIGFQESLLLFGFNDFPVARVQTVGVQPEVSHRLDRFYVCVPFA